VTFLQSFGKDELLLVTILCINTQLYFSYREKRQREEKEEQTAEPNTTTPSLALEPAAGSPPLAGSSNRLAAGGAARDQLRENQRASGCGRISKRPAAAGAASGWRRQEQQAAGGGRSSTRLAAGEAARSLQRDERRVAGGRGTTRGYRRGILASAGKKVGGVRWWEDRVGLLFSLITESLLYRG
jgi:hypothetical protein